jgi:hypothetical protein
LFPIDNGADPSCAVRTQTVDFGTNFSPQISEYHKSRRPAPFSLPSTPHCPAPNPFSIASKIARMSPSVLDPGDLFTLKYIVSHVFCPLQLPEGDDHSVRHDHSLAGAIAYVARLHSDRISNADMPQWHSISQMLDNLRAIVQFEALDRSQTLSQLSSMKVGGKLSSLCSNLEAHNV